jgi:hypothetical protein
MSRDITFAHPEGFEPPTFRSVDPGKLCDVVRGSSSQAMSARECPALGPRLPSALLSRLLSGDRFVPNPTRAAGGVGGVQAQTGAALSVGCCEMATSKTTTATVAQTTRQSCRARLGTRASSERAC